MAFKFSHFRSCSPCVISFVLFAPESTLHTNSLEDSKRQLKIGGVFPPHTQVTAVCSARSPLRLTARRSATSTKLHDNLNVLSHFSMSLISQSRLATRSGTYVPGIGSGRVGRGPEAFGTVRTESLQGALPIMHRERLSNVDVPIILNSLSWSTVLVLTEVACCIGCSHPQQDLYSNRSRSTSSGPHQGQREPTNTP